MQRRTFIAAAAILAVIVIEGGAMLTTMFLVSRGWMATIPRFTSEQIDEYFKHRDTMLGWPAPYFTVTSPCVSVYGDSFTAGTERVSYPRELSKLLGCEVSNYGVGGYGSDQAMIRAQTARLHDRAPVSIIGHVSENILRNLNQYRNLLYPGQELFFKPRFVFDGETLRTMPLPIAERTDFQRLMKSPATVLTYDEFESRPRPAFPYTMSLLRWLTGDFHVRAAIAGVPRHEPFYHADHPAGGLQLTTAILSMFAADKIRDHRLPVILLIPVGDDFNYVARGHQWPDQPLASALANSGTRVIHAGPKMMARLNGANPASLFEPSAHFNAQGYRMLAEIVADAISDLVSPPPPARDTRSPAQDQKRPDRPRHR